MLNTDNFIHQEKTRLFCGHDGARQKQDHSETVSEHKQNKNTIQTIKMSKMPPFSHLPRMTTSSSITAYINYSFVSHISEG